MILLFLPTIVICFFLLYLLSKQDFVLLRQNVSLREVFDLAALATLPAYILGRVLYIVNEVRFDLFSPLKFFHFFKFSGFSILGFFLGGAILLFFSLKGRKVKARIYDIFTISFLPLYIFVLIVRPYQNPFVLPVLFFLFTLIFFFFIKSHYKYLLRDGTISFIFLLILSLDTLIFQFLNTEKQKFILSSSVLEVISISLIISSIVGLLFVQKNAAK